MALRDTNLDKLGEGTFDVLVVGGGINGAVSAACLAARGAQVALIDRGDFAGFDQPGVVQPGVGRHQVHGELRVRPRPQALHCRATTSFAATPRPCRRSASTPRTSAASATACGSCVLGTWLYWLIGNFFTRPPRLLTRAAIAREEPIVDLSGCDGGFEYSDAYLHDNDARFVWNFVRARAQLRLRRRPTTSSRWARAAARRRLGTSRAGRASAAASFAIRARVLVNACGPFVDALNALSGQRDRAPPRLLQGHPPHRRPPHAAPARAHVLRRRRPPLLRHPHGPAHLHRHHRHARRQPGHARVTAEDRALRPRQHQQAPQARPPRSPRRTSSPSAAACARSRSRGAGGRRRLDAALAQARRRGRTRRDGHVSIFGGKLTDCLNVGEEICALRAPPRRRAPVPATRAGTASRTTRRGDEFFHQAERMDLDAMTSPRSSEKLTTRLWRRYGAEAFGLLERHPRATRAWPRCSSRAPSTSAARSSRPRGAR